MNQIIPLAPPGMSIGPARKDDARELAELYVLATDGVCQYVWSTMAGGDESLLDVGERRFAQSGTNFSFQNCLVARAAGGAIAGLMFAYPMVVGDDHEPTDDPVLAPFDALDEGGTFYVAGLVVRDEYRCNGLGRYLMRRAEDMARSHGYDRMSLLCFEANEQATRLYRSLGYGTTKRADIVPHPMIKIESGGLMLMTKPLEATKGLHRTMSLSDQWGAPVSAADQGAVDGLDKAHALFQGYFSDPVAVIDATLDAHPDFAMGHLFKAGLYALSTEKAAFDELGGMLDTLDGLAADMNDRERGHLAALKAWHRGDMIDAVGLWGDVVAECPRDAIALQFAHQGDFLFGQARMLRDRIDWVLPHWTDADPGYGYLLGMKSFGLEEMGQYDKAEDTARRALAMNPRDTWAVHGVAHVMEMQGRVEDGVAFLEGSIDDWSVDNGFSYHNWWHLALYYVEQGDIAGALRIYDESIHPAPTEVAMELLDAAALLWRLHILGHDTGSRWNDVADTYEPWAEDGYYAFNDMHAMMSFVATGRDKAAEALLSTLERRAGDTDANGVNTRNIGLPVCQAFKAFGDGDYARAVALLQPVRVIAQRFGGSHAQRDALDLTMLEAAIRAGDMARAGVFTAERLGHKPQSPLARSFQARLAA